MGHPVRLDVGVVVSYLNENRVLPAVVLVAGTGVIVALLATGIGYLAHPVLGLLGAVIWLSVKFEPAGG